MSVYKTNAIKNFEQEQIDKYCNREEILNKLVDQKLLTKDDANVRKHVLFNAYKKEKMRLILEEVKRRLGQDSSSTQK